MNPGAERELGRGYAECARLTRRFGTTYYWGALLLEPERRRHVYAVYALCRLADDIVDAPGATTGDVAGTRAALTRFRSRFEQVLDGAPGDETLTAVAHTVHTCGIDPECFERFFDAMAMDLVVTRYETFMQLCGYMEGSAAVIGEMMLPVLGARAPEARRPARALGLAFQLTNFLRDYAEDLERGRVYLPLEDLLRFGVDPERPRVDDSWRELMRFEIARNRRLYREAERGLAHLPRSSARCVATALRLYSGILGQIESRGYDVFSARARVPTWTKATTALLSLGRDPYRAPGLPAVGG